ncbi:MAG: energy transducer TonB, partial [Candidatus Competibacter sp.]
AALEAKRAAAEEAKREAAAEARRQAAEQAKREAAEQARRQAAEEAKQQAAEEARRRAAEEAKRKADEARQLAQKLAARERAKANAGAHAGNVIGPYVERHWNPLANSAGGLVCLLRITVTGSGQVTNVQVVKGSGDSLFDNSAVAAAHRASPLPMPADADVAQELRPTFILRFRPK